MAKCVISGSFDPITYGHMRLIDKAHEIFQEVHVVMASNTNKKYMFTEEERYAMLKACCFSYPRSKVVVVNTLVANYCRENDIDFIVRGVRDVTDFAYEMNLANINREISGIETMFIPTKPGTSHISSSFVRELINWKDKKAFNYVPVHVEPFIERYWK